MTSISAPPARTPPALQRRTAARVAALVLGVLLLLPGIGLAAAGCTLLRAHGVHRSDGFVTSPEDRFTASTHALVSDRIDLPTGADWLPVHAAPGDARVEVTAHGDDEVFVGIARAADATAYLHDVSRTRIEALGFGSAGIDVDARIGAEFPALGTIAWTVLAIGLGITAIGVLLVRRGRGV